MEIKADIVRKIESTVKRSCQNSSFYNETSWSHCLEVAQIARSLASKNGGNPEIAYLGGLLHDFGSVKYGRNNHHWTGARDAAFLLKSFGFAPSFIAKIIHCIYAHRSSLEIKKKTVEAACVAAADAIDHFEKTEELLSIARDNLNKSNEREAKDWVLEKFRKDWEKIPREIRPLVEENYREACRKLQWP